MLGDAALSYASDIRTHDLLGAFLVRCKIPGEGLDSYRPYVDSLPESYSVPYYCSEVESSSLPRYLKRARDKQVAKVEDSYCRSLNTG